MKALYDGIVRECYNEAIQRIGPKSGLPLISMLRRQIEDINELHSIFFYIPTCVFVLCGCIVWANNIYILFIASNCSWIFI